MSSRGGDESSDALESFEFGVRSVRSRNTSHSDADESYRALPTFHVLFCGEEPRQKIPQPMDETRGGNLT